jgi:predicted AlkP superfamily pyrophosphatase or phosphodiesterase
MKANSQGYWMPSYDGGGLLNLMGSIAAACDTGGLVYPPLAGIDISAWRHARNLVLILADGVGGDFIERTSPDGFLHRHQVATLTSVCPTTTACAIPTLMTGLPPAGHGLTGWHVYLEEIHAVAAVLPLTVRGFCLPDGSSLIDADDLYCYPKIYQRLPRASHVVTPVKIADSAFSRIHAAGATLHPYHPVAHPFIEALPFCRRKRDFFGTLRRACNEPADRKFVYGYWPDFDSAAHGSGVDSPAAVAKFLDFESRLANFMDEMRGTDTLVMVTADHGFIDSPSERQVHLDDHVAFGKMLSQPICGERRFAYCYLHPGMQVDFEDYVNTVFAGRMEAWSREKLLDEQLLGPGPVNARLASRIGDYVLAMKDDWTFVDHEPDMKPIPMIGVHGGLSRQEMLVPLCVMTA